MNIDRLFDIVEYQLKNFPLDDAFVTKVNGEWKKTSTQSFANQVNKLSRGLLKLGISPGDKIAIASHNNRTEWHVVDYALQQIGVISVPVYPTISEDDYLYIFKDADVKACFLSNQELFDKISKIKSKLSSLTGIYTFEEISGAQHWSEIIDLGENDATQDEVESLKSGIKPDDLVTLIYTSGTTGNPKGVMLTHQNVVSNLIASKERIPDPGTDHVKILSFLPICHIFERMITYLYQFSGFSMYFAESIETIGDNIKEVQPHFMTVVPRLVEKVYNKIYTKGLEAGGLKTKIFLWAMKQVEGFEPYQSKSFGHKIADRLVFKKWREGLGGNMICMISGSAALSAKLNGTFWAAGIPILEGYGLTETSPVISVNTFGKGKIRVGYVGKILNNLDVKLAEDGEIWVKGPSVTQGYYNDEEKTKEAFTEDGYFKTGDIGEFHDGLLKITDRKKEMFKTSGGKYIAPQKIENDFKQSRFIEQLMVIGEGQKMPCAIIQPEFEFIADWIKKKGIECDTSNYEEVIQNPQILEKIQKEIEKMNKSLGNWEQIKKFELTPEVWTIDLGLLTPTLKLKRKAVKERYQHLFDKLYADA